MNAEAEVIILGKNSLPLKSRWSQNGHKSGVIWFTGLSGSGKTTLAMSLEKELFSIGFQVIVLDGDDLRHSLSLDLSFSAKDRQENMRRVIAASEIFVNSGMVVLTAFISPYSRDRDTARTVIGENFHEVFLDPGFEVCEERDPKGLYKKARHGYIKDFTGISAPYEAPNAPELNIDTSKKSVEQCTKQLLAYSLEAFFL